MKDNQRIKPLITKENKPKVRIVKGKEISFRIGLTLKFNNHKSTETQIKAVGVKDMPANK